MHRLTRTFMLVAALLATATATWANQPDSLYLFAYNTNPQNGLAMAYSSEGMTWTPFEGTHSFIRSDYGTWGREKRMFSPALLRSPRGWLLVFGVNDYEPTFAITESRDLAHWRPQDYPRLKGVSQCLEPVAQYTAEGLTVRFHDAAGQWFETTASEGYHFSTPQACTAPAPVHTTALINGQQQTGTVVRIAATELEALHAYKALSDRRGARNNINLHDTAPFDFLNEKPLNAVVHPQPEAAKPISDKLIGIFFEDINYSADGGLYAELVQNRDFEYSSADGGREHNWTASNSWSCIGNDAAMDIDTTNALHPNQSHYARLTAASGGAMLVNDGFDGIPVRKGQTYDVSLFVRQETGKPMPIIVELRQGDKVIGTTTLSKPTAAWRQLSGTIRAMADADDATLCVGTRGEATLCMDMISLFPRNTFKGRKNGMRADLAQTLADLHPRFMRFPGGCVTHGDGIGNIYNWKETIGPMHARKGARNIWGYHQSRGLGYYEFFQLCEDMGCEPLPVIAAGVPCQNSSRGGGGQQGGIPFGPEMDQFVQDILDLVEWANGDPKTNKWARMRAEAGHPKPFNLKYIGIGNEDLISETFAERYLMIIKAIKQRYPDITVCGTVGPFFEGADYDEGWRIAKDNHIDMVDEHYYVAPGWYVNNQDFYDNYDRTASKVYVGEYASHIASRKSTIETALTCAMHICNLERNGDIVAMSSYAPLLAKHGHTQWNPDMIYFDNTNVYPTVDYYAQLMCGQSQGNSYIPTSVELNHGDAAVRQRIAVSTVRDTQTGRTYIKIVNLLPHPVATQLQLQELLVKPSVAATMTQLTGQLDDTEARPTQPQSITLQPQTDITLPANSFTMIAF